MWPFSNIKRWRKKRSRSGEKPLREFIYLDEVSLRSLLSSQKDGVAESSSKQTVDSNSVDATSLAEISNVALGKAQSTARFQTTNSSTLQTSRKATVQSWFRELHDMTDLRLLSERFDGERLTKPSQLPERTGNSGALISDNLLRGSLIEMRVRLASDPVFKLGTILSQFSTMASDFPEQHAAELAKPLKEIEPIYKILNHLLAGLIPIRAVAVDHVSVEYQGQEYIARRDLLRNLDLVQKPIEIVGVTDHLAYWKDIRRVLFSEAEFTILGRVSRSGLHDTWTPVKLTHLLADVVPDLAEQMNAASKMPFNIKQQQNQQAPSNRLENALHIYSALILREAGKALTLENQSEIFELVSKVASSGDDPTAQREAFATIGSYVKRAARIRLSNKTDLQLRDMARSSTGLTYRIVEELPSPAPVSVDAQNLAGPDDAARLLDVEVIAIYW